MASANRANGKRRQKANRKPKPAKAESSVPAQSESGTIPAKIWEVLNKPGVELSAQEVAAKVGTKSNVAAMLLARLAKLGDAEKTAGGKYKVVAA